MFPKLVFAAVIFFCFICLSGCQDSKSAVAAASQAAAPPTVVIARVQQKTVPLYGEFVGQIQAEASADIVARVEGVLKAMNFKEGQPVRKGQVLYQIDPVSSESEFGQSCAGEGGVGFEAGKGTNGNRAVESRSRAAKSVVSQIAKGRGP